MYYYGARYYEPRLSLWMSTDPMEEKYPATSSYCFVANNPIKYFDLDGLQLWVANNEAMSLLLHTLAPEDRGYVVRDKNGFIDSKILTEGVKHSVSAKNGAKPPTKNGDTRSLFYHPVLFGGKDTIFSVLNCHN